MSRLPQLLATLRAAERSLARAFTGLADRHPKDDDIIAMATVLGRWSNARVEALAAAIDRYGSAVPGDEPARLRAALFHGVRIGGFGLLLDLQDLLLLIAQVRGLWTVLGQVAAAVSDQPLDELCVRGREETHRQESWTRARIKTLATQATLVAPEPATALGETLPRTPAPAGQAEALWATLSAAGSIAVVGAAALAAGQPWLVPSLGPTAYLQAENPAHPSSRAWNVIVGHAVGLGAGFLAVAIADAWASPGVLTSHHVVGLRILAAGLAMALTTAATIPLRASHPPAAATTLLVALGALSTWRDALSVMAGAVVLAIVGELLRRVRLGRRPVGSATPAPAFGKEAPEQSPVLRPSAHPG